MQTAAELLEEIRHLMQLKGENPFKVRAFEKAAHAIAGRDDLEPRAKAGTLTEIPGIGKGISEVLTEFVLKGKSTARDELAASLPPGLTELTQIPGVGPKKAMQLIDELGIGSLADLEYACRENRLLNLKGFGEKAQRKILEGIRFKKGVAGQTLLSDGLELAEALMPRLLKVAGKKRLSETGPLRRRSETLPSLDFLVEDSVDRKKLERSIEEFRAEKGCSVPIVLHHAVAKRFGYELAKSTAAEGHWTAIGNPKPIEAKDEEEFYKELHLPWIPPEMRESGEEVALAKKKGLDSILPWDGVKGVFHNHTNRSDGTATLEQMVTAAKELGYSYIGISDHSQSAFYAQGLKPDTLLAQEKEIRAVQEKHPDIRIFWGIESDILADGSLDYEDRFLKRFDFVIASIHSRFKADREAMTKRIVKAITNPYTRFLGHATGRILLGRPAYEIDMPEIIEAAAKNDVAIEINANPARLDIDWRWGAELRKWGTKVSINPDAHEVAGLKDTRYGIAVARKALLPAKQVVNAGSVAEVERWLERKG